MSKRRITEYLDSNRLHAIELLQNMIRIPSVNPPGGEGPIARLVADELQRLGFEIRMIEVEEGRPNVIATLHGKRGSPRFVCYAHFDVVPAGDRRHWHHDPFGGDLVGDKIFGRGAVDHKSPIAALISATRAVLDSQTTLLGDLLFTFVVDEESMGYKGMRHIAEHHLVDADLGLYCTHTSVKTQEGHRVMPWMGRDNVLIAHNGKMWVRVTMEGKTAHTMSLESGLNAIEKAGLAISALGDLARTVNKREHPLTGVARMSMNMIRGGSKDNMLPDKCEIDIDRRYTPAEDSPTVLQEIREVIDLLQKRESGFVGRVEIVTDDPPSEIPSDSRIVQATKDVAEEVTGRVPLVTGTSATSDSRWFVRNLGIPMAMFGLGDLFQAHRPDEHIAVQDLIDTAKVYALIILELLS